MSCIQEKSVSVPTLDCDLGNTRVKWRFGSSQGEGSFEDRDCFQLLGVARVRLASVLSRELTETWIRRCELAWPGVIVDLPQVEPLSCGLVPAYKNPESMGIDRWLALAAVWEPGLAVCAVSAGTALTIDFADADGQHLGGYIAPGIDLGRRALREHTARVRSQHSRLFDAQLSPGKDTKTCVEHALRLAHVGLIKEAVNRVESRSQPFAVIHLSGGNARWLAPLLEREVKIHKNLVLDGLAKVLP